MRAPVLLLALLGAAGCGETTPEGASAVQERIDLNNSPSRIPGMSGLEYRLEALPTAGAATSVWTGHWWPLSQGGTSRSLDKHDRVLGNTRAGDWERADARANGGVWWHGHCNGLAAAGTMTPEPLHDVTYQGVSFSVADVKALLTELWQGGGTGIGGRCEDETPVLDGNGRMVEAGCRNLNPATLHVALANFLGRQGKPVIVDVSPGKQVWNYAVKAFQTSLTFADAAGASAALRLASGAYAYNPSAARFALADTVLTLASGDTKRYGYVLELDAQGKILGGEWTGGSKTDHPDFIWRHTRPTPDNPYVDRQLVETLLRMSRE